MTAWGSLTVGVTAIIGAGTGIYGAVQGHRAMSREDERDRAERRPKLGCSLTDTDPVRHTLTVWHDGVDPIDEVALRVEPASTFDGGGFVAPTWTHGDLRPGDRPSTGFFVADDTRTVVAIAILRQRKDIWPQRIEIDSVPRPPQVW